MCKSKAEGGQRCAGHASAAMRRANMAYAMSPTLEKYERVLDCQEAFASTPGGAAIMEAAIEGSRAAGSHGDADNLQRVLDKGRLLRERNKAMEELLGVKQPKMFYSAIDEAGRPLGIAADDPRNAPLAAEISKQVLVPSAAERIREERTPVLSADGQTAISRRFGCESHDAPGGCNEECVELAANMDGGAAGPDYDETGTSYGPPRPYTTFDFDAEAKAVIRVEHTPVEALDAETRARLLG